MSHKLQASFAVLLCLISARQGYALGERPFLMVQVCLENEQNLPNLVSMMQSIAKSEGMKFIDNSAQTQRDLESIGEIIHQAKPTSEVINIGIESDNGAWLTAGNVGLPKNQVVLGFSEGAKPSEAHKFADAVVHRLEERWHIEVVRRMRVPVE